MCDVRLTEFAEQTVEVFEGQRFDWRLGDVTDSPARIPEMNYGFLDDSRKNTGVRWSNSSDRFVVLHDTESVSLSIVTVCETPKTTQKSSSNTDVAVPLFPGVRFAHTRKTWRKKTAEMF
ncbi:hypothetical protein AUR66_10055 [Haloferax profundi]|uniref:Uncharacterized protein n=1 Tax=Haloferax profundi TaxID=1544718 RepID=A0A0W1SUF6_9EURY|nr:hypothetical protein AUR66_10055 [Haloferax profundi]